MSGMVVKGSPLEIGPLTPIKQGDLNKHDTAKKGTGGTTDKLKTFMNASDKGPATTTAGPYIKDSGNKAGIHPAAGLVTGELFEKGSWGTGGFDNGYVYSGPGCDDDKSSVVPNTKDGKSK